MKKTVFSLLCLGVVSAFPALHQAFADETTESASRIQKYTPEVTKLAEATPPQPGGVLMVGSSIFRKWVTCTNDLAPFPVTNRGFGGSQTQDQLHFFEQIVPTSQASLVIWYCGSNDINGSQDPNNSSKTSESILQRTKEWIGLTRKALPQSNILLVSVIRAPQKREKGFLDKVDEVNRGLAHLAASTPGVSYVDVNPSLENSAGEPVPECYVADKLHMTPEGYTRMASVMKPVMGKIWKPSSTPQAAPEKTKELSTAASPISGVPSSPVALPASNPAVANTPQSSPAAATVGADETTEKKTAAPEVTPTSLPGAEAMVYKKVGDVELRLFIVKPKGWTPSDKRPCLVSYFGGGWSGGTPTHSIGYAKWSASLGMVGVAPDYRTRTRFNTTPEDCVADGRAAVRWLQDHASELGIDPAKMVSLGASAGGHVAAWTAITDPVSPPTSADPVPKPQPAALILLWPVTDTTASGYGGPKRFGGDEARAAALSVTGRMPAKMPPTIVFHGTGDKTVKFENSQAFLAKMKANGNSCLLTPFPDGPHSPTSSKGGTQAKEWQKQLYEESKKFLLDLGLIKVSDFSPAR